MCLALKYSSGATIEPSEIMESFFRDYVRLYHEQGVLAYVNGAVAETLKPLGLLHGVRLEAVSRSLEGFAKGC